MAILNPPQLSRFDGILGLAYDTISVNHITPPFYNMIAKGLLDAPIFSFRIGSSEQDGGEAVFGGINPSAYTGDITYVPVRRRAYWEVELSRVTLGDTEIPLSPSTGAAIDTGSSNPSRIVPSSVCLNNCYRHFSHRSPCCYG
jgi:saccharopepsin